MSRDSWTKLPESERKRRLAERFAGMAEIAEGQGRPMAARGYRRTARVCAEEAGESEIWDSHDASR